MKKTYEKDFEVELCTLQDAPKDKSSAAPLGRHLDGCRIGFDTGGSDRKASAVKDGKRGYSEEVVLLPSLTQIRDITIRAFCRWDAYKPGFCYDGKPVIV